jgi:hypothetical protein
MDNFWEKLKDILYDSTDYIIMLITILIVVLIINWRIGGLFSKNKIENNEKDNIETAGDDNQLGDTEDSDETEDGDTPDEIPDELIKVTIPNGLLPIKVGEILQEHDLIEDKNEFVQKTIEMEKDTKLKSGNFEIPKNSTLEEIINIISR